ncbi:MAG: hypothetical protein V7695_12480 [Sulfitobacter sp.]
MKNVVLHIGMHKTGSSSIQSSLKNYRDETTRYASFDEANHSIPMTTIFSSGRYEYHVWKNIGLSKEEIDERRERYLEVLQKDIDDPNFKRLLISGEDIGTLQNDDKRALVEFLKSRGCNVKIVCFVRSPNGYVASEMQELIKHGWEDVLQINPAYKWILWTFSEVLPKENLIVRNFSEILSEFADPVLGFASICGLERESFALKRTNQSLSATATRLLYRLNKLPLVTLGTRDHVSARHKLIAILAKAFPASRDDKLDGDILSGLLKPNLDDQIAFLSDRFQIDFSNATHSTNLDACEYYLTDLSSFKLQRLVEALGENQIQLPQTNTIDQMLMALYQSGLGLSA